MKIFKKILKVTFGLLLLPVIFLLVSGVLTFIPVGGTEPGPEQTETVFVHSNGVHLDVILPLNRLDSTLLSTLKYGRNDKYMSFGWGDENFYLNVPTWDDLTAEIAVRALILESHSLVHVSRHRAKNKNWLPIKVNKTQLAKLNAYIKNSFAPGDNFMEGKGYTDTDEFYRAVGSYSIFNTCNSWVNSALKESGIRACLWTPFDFGLLRIHRKE